MPSRQPRPPSIPHDPHSGPSPADLYWRTMQRDIRSTVLYQEAEALFRILRQPGTGQISDAAEGHASPDGQQAVFAATLVDTLEGTHPNAHLPGEFEVWGYAGTYLL